MPEFMPHTERARVQFQGNQW